jgi:hypothetical protein
MIAEDGSDSEKKELLQRIYCYDEKRNLDNCLFP